MWHTAELPARSTTKSDESDAERVPAVAGVSESSLQRKPTGSPTGNSNYSHVRAYIRSLRGTVSALT